MGQRVGINLTDHPGVERADAFIENLIELRIRMRWSLLRNDGAKKIFGSVA
jgi:hypothetical protein